MWPEITRVWTSTELTTGFQNKSLWLLFKISGNLKKDGGLDTPSLSQYKTNVVVNLLLPTWTCRKLRKRYVTMSFIIIPMHRSLSLSHSITRTHYRHVLMSLHNPNVPWEICKRKFKLWQQVQIPRRNHCIWMLCFAQCTVSYSRRFSLTVLFKDRYANAEKSWTVRVGKQ